MSRSGYSDDGEQWELIRWRGAVASAIRGRRGQAFLRELRDALDAMPEKSLVAEVLEEGGEVCAIGALGRQRGVDISGLDPENPEGVAQVFDVAPALVKETVFLNDECGPWCGDDTPELRWQRMRDWVEGQIREHGTEARDE